MRKCKRAEQGREKVHESQIYASGETASAAPAFDGIECERVRESPRGVLNPIFATGDPAACERPWTPACCRRRTKRSSTRNGRQTAVYLGVYENLSITLCPRAVLWYGRKQGMYLGRCPAARSRRSIGAKPRSPQTSQRPLIRREH